jgi:hypothetical protein
VSAAQPVPTFVFVVSFGNSGSSLVHEVLARHPEVGFLSNIQDRLPMLPARAGALNNSLYRRVPQALTRKGRMRFAPSEGWRALVEEVSPMLAESSRDLTASDATPWVATRFRSFFHAHATAQGKGVFLHKLTGWPRTGFIRAVYPDARFVHVYRDGRAVVDSDLRTSWWRGYLGPEFAGYGPLSAQYATEWEASARSFAVLAAIGWKIAMDAYAMARAQVPGEQWLDVRFEDVLEDPWTRFKEMIEFIGLKPSPTFDKAVARTAFQTDRRDTFRRHLDSNTLTLVEKVLGGHLKRWGYER